MRSARDRRTTIPVRMAAALACPHLRIIWRGTEIPSSIFPRIAHRGRGETGWAAGRGSSRRPVHTAAHNTGSGNGRGRPTFGGDDRFDRAREDSHDSPWVLAVVSRRRQLRQRGRRERVSGHGAPARGTHDAKRRRGGRAGCSASTPSADAQPRRRGGCDPGTASHGRTEQQEHCRATAAAPTRRRGITTGGGHAPPGATRRGAGSPDKPAGRCGGVPTRAPALPAQPTHGWLSTASAAAASLLWLWLSRLLPVSHGLRSLFILSTLRVPSGLLIRFRYGRASHVQTACTGPAKQRSLPRPPSSDRLGVRRYWTPHLIRHTKGRGKHTEARAARRSRGKRNERSAPRGLYRRRPDGPWRRETHPARRLCADRARPSQPRPGR